MDIESLKYHKDHCWVRIEGNTASIGITDYAQEELGEIVYIDPIEKDDSVAVDEEMTEIESTKTTAPVIAPISGTILDFNEELKESPELLNDDPYGKGWIAVIRLTNKEELDELMTYAEYEEYKSDL